jgi:hypothetical protein
VFKHAHQSVEKSDFTESSTDQTIKCQSIMANPNPKPPKRKKGTAYSRHASGKKNKQTSYNFEAAREELGVPNANAQQIRSAALRTGDNPRARAAGSNQKWSNTTTRLRHWL